LGLGRKSLAEEYLDEVPAEEDRSDGRARLVMYDFDSKPNPRFWLNLRRLVRLLGESSLVQYSVFMTGSRRGAIVAERLARHYGARVDVFMGEKVVF
jgi:hypothetical protein